MEFSEQVKEYNASFARVQRLEFLSKIFKTKKIILTLLEEEAKSSKLILTLVLKYAHVKSEINLSKNPNENFNSLKSIISKSWGIEEDINELFDCMFFNKIHTKGEIEFIKNEKIVILNGSAVHEIPLSRLKKFIISIKNIENLLKNKLNYG